MKVLISVASKHGSTAEIASAIGDVLNATGIETVVRRPEDVTTVEGYDGVVLGSGVYAGHWLAPATQLVQREATALTTMPVWLFSSGPLGDPAKPDAEPSDVAGLVVRTHAIDHQTFPGMLDRRELGLAEKAIVAVVRAPDGDYRPWEAVTDWAAGIAATLQARHTA